MWSDDGSKAASVMKHRERWVNRPFTFGDRNSTRPNSGISGPALRQKTSQMAGHLQSPRVALCGRCPVCRKVNQPFAALPPKIELGSQLTYAGAARRGRP